MKNLHIMIQSKHKFSILLAFLFTVSISYAQVINKVELNYDGSTISDATQTSWFAPEVTASQSGGALMLDVASMPDDDTIYMIELTETVDISEDPNIFAKIESDAQLKYMGVILEDINGNLTTGNTGSDQFFLPGKADTSYYLSFSDGSNNQASVQDELTANGVDSTQIKKILFVNNSGAEFTGKIWFKYLQLGTEDTFNGAVKTDSTLILPFDGKRMFGNGLAGIGMDSWMKVGIVQDDVLHISLNERLDQHSYMTVFIFDPLLDLSKDNAVFDLKMKSDVEVQLLFRFEDINGQRVDLVDVVPELTNDFQLYRFDVNNRFSSNPDFDASQIKEFHIRKISAENVNGTVTIDDLNIGVPYFDRYENMYEGIEISDMTQTSTFAPEVAASQLNGMLELDITNLADQDTFYMIEFDRPLDISADPNIWIKIKSDAEMQNMGVRLVDAEGNYTTGKTTDEIMHLPGISDKFLNYSFSAGSNTQMGIQTEMTTNNVDSTQIKKLIFFNNSEAAFSGKIWFDYLRFSTADTDNGVVLTDTAFYAPFDGERTFGNGLKAVAMDSKAKIGIAQDDVLHVSMMEELGEHSYLTVFVFDDTLDLSNGNSNMMFKMKADIEVDILLRYEDFNGERVDLHNFVPEISDTFITYAFDVNHRFTSNPSFKPDQIKEFHFRKLSSDAVNGNLVIDDFQLGVRDIDAPEAPAGLTISEVTDTTALLEWEMPTDDFGVHEYNIYANGELIDNARYPGIRLIDLDGTLTFSVTALDRAGNESAFSNEVTETFTATNIQQLLSEDDIKIYPNPVSNSINIKSRFPIQIIKVYTVSGKEKIVYHSESKNVLEVKLNTFSLNKGLHIMKVQTSEGTLIKKIVKE